MKKITLLLALTGILTFNSLTAQTVIASGNCGADGDNLTWVLTSDSLLTISGSGAMVNFNYSVGYPWFSYRSSISTIIIGNSITSIGVYAFYNCQSLTSVNIGNSVTDIGNATFANCRALALVNIPNTVTSIGDFAFAGCHSLTSVSIPNSVTSIRYSTFSGCIGLTSVTIGNSVRSIEDGAFAGCRSLSSITCFADIPPILVPNSFERVPDDVTVCVPADALRIYQGSVWYSRFSDMSGCAPVGISEKDEKAITVTLYPNPTTGMLNIKNGTVSIKGVKIFDLFGRNVHHSIGKPVNSSTNIDISHLSAGIYIVKIATEKGEITRKIVKQ